MRAFCLLVVLILAACPAPDQPNAAVNNQPAKPVRTESRVVLLYYGNSTEKEAEEKRLNDTLAEGWRVVTTDTKADQRDRLTRWTVTVVLERELAGQ